jgi:hypothetical protein
MNVQIDIHQERTVEEGPVFRVRTITIYTYGIDPNIFVHDVETDSFSHVATVWDILNVSTDRTIAQVNLEPYYRKDSAVVDFASQAAAIDAAAYTVGRVASLAQLYDQMNTIFAGEDDYSFVEP